MRKKRIKEVYLEPETLLHGLRATRPAAWVAVLVCKGDSMTIPFAQPDECDTETALQLARERLLS